MKKVSEKTLHEGKWLKFKEVKFLNKNKMFHWECVERKQSHLVIAVLATLKPSERIVLIKQFRPAVNHYVLGLPAGIIHQKCVDEDSLNQQVLKEFQEETGYIGHIEGCSPQLKSGSGVLSDDFRLFELTVDENDSKNANPKQQLEVSEEIEVILIDKKLIRDYLMRERKKGIHIGAGLWYLFGFKHH